MLLQPISISKNSHTAVNVVLDTAYQGIDAATWAELFVGARKSKTQMQDSLCNWEAACVVTQTVIVPTNLDVLATVANIVDL